MAAIYVEGDRLNRIKIRWKLCGIGVLAMGVYSCAPTRESAANSDKKLLTSTVRVVSINLAHSLKNGSDVQKFSQWIKSTGADIVAVQQIDRPQQGKESFDPVRELAGKAEMYQFFGKARYWQGFDSGNALFSIYPIRQTVVHPLPVGKGKVRRSLTYGVIDVGLRQLAVASTELDDQSESERLGQVQEIRSVAHSAGEFPFVVCGSFNEPLTGKAASRMQEQFVAANALQEAAVQAEQHVYSIHSASIQPLSVEKARFGSLGSDALVVTFQITQ